MMQGILIVDKPTDWTSFDVIAKLRAHKLQPLLRPRFVCHHGVLR